jgi:hypothetical protein
MIIAAGGREADIRDLLAEYGPAACAEALVAEVVSRCEAPKLAVEVSVRLDVEHDGERFGETLLLTGGTIRRAPAEIPDPYVRIGTGLVDLLRSVFGPVRFTGDAVRQVLIRTDVPLAAEDDAPVAQRFHIGGDQLSRLDQPNPLAQAAQALTAACASRWHDLGDLAIRFGSDKWGVWHWYTRHYDEHFAPLRDEPVKVLEIGIGGYSDPHAGGGSLRMWKNYFPRGIIYGMDIYDKSPSRESRIETVVGSQADAEFLREFAEEHGPFDIVIDDGSHVNEHVLFSFDVLFPYVRPGGWYAIEDMQTSYWPQYGGARGATAGEGTGVGLLKQLLDGLEYQEGRQPDGHQPGYSDLHVVGVHFYHNLAFIEKGRNAEATAPAWVKKAPVKFFYSDQPGR